MPKKRDVETVNGTKLYIVPLAPSCLTRGQMGRFFFANFASSLHTLRLKKKDLTAKDAQGTERKGKTPTKF